MFSNVGTLATCRIDISMNMNMNLNDMNLNYMICLFII